MVRVNGGSNELGNPSSRSINTRTDAVFRAEPEVFRSYLRDLFTAFSRKANIFPSCGLTRRECNRAQQPEGQDVGHQVGHFDSPAVELLEVMLMVPEAAGAAVLLIDKKNLAGSTCVISVTHRTGMPSSERTRYSINMRGLTRSGRVVGIVKSSFGGVILEKWRGSQKDAHTCPMGPG